MTTLTTILTRGLLAAGVVLASSQLQASAGEDNPTIPAASQSVQQQSAITPAPSSVSSAPEQKEQDGCRWWKPGCEEREDLEGLPAEAPRTGTVITVDAATNRAYLFQDGKLVDTGLAATGTGKVLKKGLKVWAFHTPRGRLKVLRKIVDPVWRKPDWAFVEVGERIPPPDSPSRMVKGHLGKYALDLGDGIMIHGTDDVNSLGRKASHGCIRLSDDMLERVYKAAKVGTDVYVFDSNVSQTASASRPEAARASDAN